jgi:SAM-dependent methyltransferase
MSKPISDSSLRELLLERYISTSAGVHRPLTPRDLQSSQSALRHYLRDWVPVPASGGWLDLGCGQGTLMRLARSLGYEEVVGIDISSEMLISPTADGLAVVRDDIAKYLSNCQDARWAVVTAFDVIEHFPKEEGFNILKEIRRVLRPEGVCLLQLPNAGSPWAYGVMASDLTHEAAYSPASISQLAKLAGFSHCEVRELGPPPGTLMRSVRRMLWRFVRLLYQFTTLVETGGGTSNVFTRVMLVRLSGGAE